MIDIIKAIILGLVEGITEWLPISSTGHMILVNEFLKINVSPKFMELFLVVIQLGAIMAVVVLYWKRLWPFAYDKGIKIKKATVTMWFKVLVSCFPAAIIGIPFGDKIDELFYNYKTVAISLIVFGVLFILVENLNKHRKPNINTIAEITYKVAIIIGFFQLIAAIFPGTSRSGATILGAILIGVSRKTAAEFTFFLAVPVMLGASIIKLLKFGFDFSSRELSIIFWGMFTAFIVSIIAIKFLINYIKTNDFKAFGWYRIVLGVLVLVFFSLK